jgi:hypothetical protein
LFADQDQIPTKKVNHIFFFKFVINTKIYPSDSDDDDDDESSDSEKTGGKTEEKLKLMRMLKKAAYRGSKLHNAILQSPSTATSGELKVSMVSLYRALHEHHETFQALSCHLNFHYSQKLLCKLFPDTNSNISSVL